MSKAYKCDVCGKFCSNYYKITGFDIYPGDYAERGYPNVNKKTSCELNNGKDFCFYCKNSYRYKTYWGVTEIEKCGCLLDVSCEDFKKKEYN